MKRTFKLPSITFILLAALLTFLTGCAVMRVDVDVYKGPLADEEHVQIQRLAVLAVGAKPLLLQTRNKLMKKTLFETFEAKGYLHNDVIRYERKCVSEKTDSSPDDDCDGGSFSEAPTSADWEDRDRARIINDILLLYDNEEGYTGYESYIVTALKALEKLRDAVSDLSGTRALKSEHASELKKENPALYQKFVRPFVADSEGSNADMQTAASVAFESREELRTAETKSVPAVRALQIELYNALDGLPTANSQARQIVRALISALVYNDRGTGANGRIMSEQRRTIVRMALVFLNINLAQRELKRNAMSYRDCSDIDDQFSPIFKEVTPAFRAAADEVGRQLFCAPSEFGRDLLKLDKNWIEDGMVRGIAWLPNQGTDGSNNWFTRVESTAQAVSSSLHRTIGAGALSAGRVGPGLEQLMDDYLKAQHEVAADADQKERQLADALIQFAQKMLFVSNNSIFLERAGKRSSSARAKESETSTKRVDCGATDATKNGKVGCGNENTEADQLDCGRGDVSKKDKAECANLFSVIEVVGNSILVQANELHARGEHTKETIERGAARRKSIATAFSGSPITVVDSILGRISARKAEIEAALAPESKLVAKLGTVTEEASAATIERDKRDKVLAEKKGTVATQEKLVADRMAALDGSSDPVFLGCLPVESNPVTPASELARFAKAEPCAKSVLAATPANETERKKRMTELARELQVRAVSLSLAAFRLDIATDNKATEEQLKKSREAVATAEAEVSKAKGTEDDKKKQVADAKTATKKFREDNAEWMRIAERYTPAVMTVLDDTAKKALNDPAADAASIHLQWLNLIQASSADEAIKSHAAALVSSTPSPVSAPPDLLEPDKLHCDAAGVCPYCKDETCPPDAMQSMDALIAWLQANRTRILADYGEKSDVYLSAEAAIKQAQLDRAGLTYIRPASSYLRSSYPASLLQQNQTLGWQNMLGVSYKRSVPLLGGALRNDSYYDVINALDKQFWQNINTVRVSGGGRSNYALVKDDVGNWTVRAFSTNYKGLLKSLSGMALFNYGEKLDASLALNDGTPRAIGEARLTSKSSGMGGLFASYRDAFAAERLKDYNKLAGELNSPSMASAIKSAWDADAAVKDAVELSDAKKQLDGIYEKHLKSSADKVADTAKPEGSELIYETLASLRAFKKDLLTISATFTAAAQTEFEAAKAAVDAANARPENDPDKPKVLADANTRFTKADTDKKNADAAASKAQSIAVGKVGPLIASVTASRDASIREYERALAFIGEAANRDAAPDSVVPSK